MTEQNVFHHTVREASVNVEVASTTRGPTWKIELKDARPDELESILVKARDVLTKLLMPPEEDTEEVSE